MMQKIPNSIINLFNEDFHLLVVKKEEDFNYSEILLQSELETFFNLKTEKRKQEFLNARYLRNYMIGQVQILYRNSGAPFLYNDERFISISHSKDFLGVIVSKFKCGLDIEEISNKPEKVKTKFLNVNESSFIPNNPENLTRAWTIKEVLYKICDFPIKSYTNELLILNWEKKICNGQVRAEHESYDLTIHSLVIDELVISYTFDICKN